MSIYMQATASVAGSLVKALDKTQAQQTFDAVYADESRFLSANRTMAGRIDANQLNLLGLVQEKISSDTHIRMLQDDAEARVRVSAAHAGVEGGSVESAVEQTGFNESMRLGENRRNFENNREKYIQQAEQLRYDVSSIPKPKELVHESPWLAALSSAAPILGSKEFANRLVNLWGESSNWSGGEDEEQEAGDVAGKVGRIGGTAASTV